MRILTFSSLFPNATDKTFGVFIYQRMAHVHRRPGNQVCVVAPVPYFPSWLRIARWRALGQIPRIEEIGGMTIYHPRYLMLPRVSMYVQGILIFLGSFLLVRKLHRQKSFDCIDAHYIYPDCFAAVIIGKLLRLPVIASARGTDINLYPKFRGLRPMIRWTLKNTAGNIGVCRALADEMIALGAPPGKVTVIGNGVDLNRFHPVDRKEARRQLNVPQDAIVAVAVGALIPRKGYQFLIPALAAIAEQFPSLRLYIVGKGEQSELKVLAESQGVADRVFFAGSRPNEELNLWYSAADVSCLVSSREGWPNVVLESLACGTPVLATGLWGVPEILVSPELGIMVQQQIAEIADGLAQALTKIWDRNRIINYARTRTWDAVADEVEKYFAHTLKEKITEAHQLDHQQPAEEHCSEHTV
jgi:teichuronic acid biosynthesis glycosyltransferase TuaC